MRRCRSKRKRLVAYLDAELPPRQLSRLETHLQTCQTCQAAMERLRHVSDVLRHLRSPERSEAYWEQQLLRFRTKFHTREEPRQPLRIWTWQWILTRPLQTLAPAICLLAVATVQVMDLLGLDGQMVDLLGWWLVVSLGP
jgi:anti-sigma factor RsiW